MESTHSTETFATNIKVLEVRFPEVAKQVLSQATTDQVTLVNTQQGPALCVDGQCLDHQDKPESGGKVWAERLMADNRFQSADHIVVFGLGLGYHVDSLLKQAQQRKVSVLEPSVQAFKAALSVRDISSLLSRIENLSVGNQSELNFIKPGTELAVRSQSQAVSAEYYQQVKTVAYQARGFASLHPNIAVLGPLQGGTLPIAAYCARALGSLKQRKRELDVSGFAPAYHIMENFLKEKLRQQVMQGNFVEMISQLVVEAATEHPIDVLICMAQAPISGRALTHLRKMGVTTVLWFVEDYLRFTYWRDSAKYYDFVFTIQKDPAISQIKSAGAGEVHYLPTACDPAVHGPLSLSAQDKARWGSPISFVGAGYYNRQQAFASFAELPFKIWGTEWPTCRPFDGMLQEQGRRLSPEEYVKIFNATDININLHSSNERDDVDPYGDFINPRTFELAACAAFQLCDERSLLSELFEPGKEIVTFRDKADLREKIDYYLSRPEERRVIAERARQRVLRDHTYEGRIKQMLSIIYASKFEHLKRRELESPWGKMLKRAEGDPVLLKYCQAAFAKGEAPKMDAIVAEIMTGQGNLNQSEQKLLFLHHLRSQIVNMEREERTSG
jgi:spore maturation protein CgeB